MEHFITSLLRSYFEPDKSMIFIKMALVYVSNNTDLVPLEIQLFYNWIKITVELKSGNMNCAHRFLMGRVLYFQAKSYRQRKIKNMRKTCCLTQKRFI